MILLSFFFFWELQACQSKELGRIVNIAGKQRMLTQKIVKEALFIKKDIKSDQYLTRLVKSAKTFEFVLNGLINGNNKVNPQKCGGRIVRKQLRVVRDLWQDFQGHLEKVKNNEATEETYRAIANLNLPILREMNRAVGIFERSTSQSKIQKTSDLKVKINLAGKQRMLTQKMTKEFLLISANIDSEKNLLLMKRTAVLFDRTLKGLRDGDSDLKIGATRDETILSQLQQVEEIWANYKKVIYSVIDGQEITSQRIDEAEQLNIPLLREMNKAVRLYEKSII